MFERISAALIAIAIFGAEFLYGTVAQVWLAGEVPCTMSGVERLAALLCAVTLVFVALNGLAKKLAGLIALQCVVGIWMCSRHVAMHGTNDVAQGFGSTFCGLHGYGWSLVLFVAVILWLAVCLCFAKEGSPGSLPFFSKIRRPLAGFSCAVVLFNALTVLLTNGPPPFAGVGIPDRFTLASVPERWSLSLWDRVAAGPVFFDRPFLKNGDPLENTFKPEEGPVTPSGVLAFGKPVAVPSPFENGEEIRAFDWNEARKRYGFSAATPSAAFTDGTIHRVTASAIPDAANGLTLDETAGAVWVGDRFVTITQNKTMWALENVWRNNPDDRVGLVETTGNVRLSWGRARHAVHTVRARNAFARTLAYDLNSSRLLMIARGIEPDSHPVLVALDATDLLPLAEIPLRSDKTSGLREGRTLAEYRPTAMTWANGLLYAWCPRFSSLLVIDPDRARVLKVLAGNPAGEVLSMTTRDGRLNILLRTERGYALSETDIPVVEELP